MHDALVLGALLVPLFFDDLSGPSYPSTSMPIHYTKAYMIMPN